MRAATGLLLAFLCLFAPTGARAEPAEPVAAVTLTAPCERPGDEACPVHVTLDGPITAAAADRLAAILNAEQTRVGARIRPQLTIQSRGGDLKAAFRIGREMRKRLGAVISNGPCHAACVYAAIGAVERKLAGVGLQRPLGASLDPPNFFEADQSYKISLLSIRDYLFEMNVSEDLLLFVLSLAPGEMKVLSPVDARTLGLSGVDPAYEDFRTAQEARRYGLTSAELRKREAQLDARCGREDDARSLAELRERDECRAQSRDGVLWGFEGEKYELFSRSAATACGAKPAGSQAREACLRAVAESIRAGAPKER